MNATLEVNAARLRNFHKAHFPGQYIPSLRETSTVLPDSLTPTWQEEDEDERLGWYHDGVKRTITDEQIAMFRHSEIHRLLQQKGLNANLAGDRSVVQVKEEPNQTKQARREMKNKPLGQRATLQSEDVELGYGQEGDKLVPEPGPEPGQGKRSGHRRKVVRYMEELDQSSISDGIDGSSHRSSASQSFHWPKLGS